jgi:hypothetical protein
MTDRPEDDPGANTEMFRAYVEHDDVSDRRVSLTDRPAVLVGAAVVVVLVVVLLILAL